MVGAIFFPNFRLSISFGSQIINFFGMLMILLFIDQILFKAIDTRKFGDVIMAYVGGRLAGFVLVSLAFIMFSLTL